MPLMPPIFLAASEGVGLDLVVWLIAGAIWLFGQIAAAKKMKEKKARQSRTESSTSSTLQPGGGNAPPPNELAEIFRRLGADIPATPPPPPPPASAAPHRPQKKPAHKNARRKTPAEHIQPILAQRLAQVRKAAEEAAQLAETERIAAQSAVPEVQSRPGQTRALDTATQHTGTILPSLYAMSCRMAPLPSLPMPGLDRTHPVNQPLRAKLRARREVRDALIAQMFLQPPKSFSR